ncbi:TetR/AcrR family transcriptional regulator [Telmatocola sphagniphila]|uniref:TetR/AcrR family transcriptional regulator n=1 Tax=Telmatocola sphagniphila TaxID=1123043 RepID=A0A8E6B6V1_9BACT|nr:TetR/AcrR family transcriptional regulator [Telmatocola sphagniphila]QVL33195.1 TetR/AcrR family transcriptional regulator [Telmatocola sphagniphila]
MKQLSARRGRPKDSALIERRRDSILAAASRIFAAKGYPDTDIQEIADRSGVAKGTVYLYFSSKEELFLATVDRAMRSLSERISAATEAIEDPIDRLEMGVKTYFAHFRENPAHAELLIIERAEYRDRKTPTYIEHKRVNCTRWEPIYESLIEMGRIRQMPVDRIIRVTSDLMYGTMFTDHFLEKKRTPEEQATDVLDVVFHGILTPAECRRRKLRGA